MAVKYHCRKCGKRFIDWGAEKLGFKCPDCGDEELVRLGASDEKGAKKPSLKRKPRRIIAAAAASEEGLHGGDADEMDAEEPEADATDSIFLDTEDEDARAGVDLDEVIPADDLGEAEPVDLDVGEDIGFDGGGGGGTEPIDEPLAETEEWSG